MSDYKSDEERKNAIVEISPKERFIRVNYLYLFLKIKSSMKRLGKEPLKKFTEDMIMIQVV